MDPGTLAAWIGLGGTIGGAAMGAILPWALNRKVLVRNESYDRVTGSILAPKPNDTVGRTFECSGVVTGMQPGLRLWLAVEVGELVWPKESKVSPNEKNEWRTIVFEDGRSPNFSVALFLADPAVDQRIAKWLENGRRTGTYADLRGIQGARRIARVDGLHLT